MAQGVVYMFTNKLNGKMYIGQTIHEDLRIKHHLYAASHPNTKNEGQPFVQALRKYGIDSFDYTRLFVTDDIDDKNELRRILEEKEQYYIKEYDSVNKGYNMTEGGGGMKGFMLPPSAIDRIRKANTGRKLREEHRIANIKRFAEIRKDPEYIRVMSERMSGEGNPMYGVRLFGDRNHNFGKSLSEDTKRKISETKKGKPGHKHTNDTKKLLSGLFKGVPKSDETKKKISASLKGKESPMRRKPVVQYTKDGVFVKEWESIKEAELTLGIIHVSESANGKRNYAGGYIWRYKSECDKDIPPLVRPLNVRRIAQVDEKGTIIKEFNSIREASKELNLKYSGISNVLNGSQNKTGNNYRFIYIDH